MSIPWSSIPLFIDLQIINTTKLHLSITTEWQINKSTHTQTHTHRNTQKHIYINKCIICGKHQQKYRVITILEISNSVIQRTEKSSVYNFSYVKKLTYLGDGLVCRWFIWKCFTVPQNSYLDTHFVVTPSNIPVFM